MNGNVSGLDETEQIENMVSAPTEAAQPEMVSAPSNGEEAPGQAVDPASMEASEPSLDVSDTVAPVESPVAVESPASVESPVPVESSVPEENPEPSENAASSESSVPEENPEPSESSVSGESSAPEPEAADEGGLKPGSLVEGTITSTTPTAVFVTVGDRTDGIIPGSELERMNRETLEILKPGAVVSLFVVNAHAQPDNHLKLSLNRALEELDWQRAEEYRASQEVYESHVGGYNKGGLIVRFGRVRGFVPQSQLGPDRRQEIEGETPEERWGKMVNQPIAVKVMEVDRGRNRLILSERAAVRESRESRKEALISRLQVGEVRTGRVVSLVDFGVFVDIGGAEGLVHLTELSWTHVTHPKELLKIGQEVKVEVISVDPDAKRIGLSMKRQEADPWDTVAINYQVGQLVRGVVTKMTKFGAFVRLADLPEIEGLVHISELSDQRVNHPREVLNEGETVTLRVVKMDIENRRLGLSLKKVNSAEYLDMDWSGGGAG